MGQADHLAPAELRILGRRLRIIGGPESLAASNTAKLPDGALVWVESVASYFQYQKSSTETPDQITVVQAIGPGRFSRVQLGDPPASVLTQANWTIDPATGSDENPGTDAAPLASAAELVRRIDGALLPQTTFVKQLGDLAERPILNLRIASSADRFVWYSPPSSWTTVLSGTLTGTTAILRTGATPEGQLIEDTNVADWSPFYGLRLRLTDGPNAGATCFIMQDLGAGVARVSPFLATIDATAQAGAVVNNVSPAAAGYVVERMPGLDGLDLTVLRVGNSAPSAYAILDSLEFMENGGPFNGHVAVRGSVNLIDGLGAIMRSRFHQPQVGEGTQMWAVGCGWSNNIDFTGGSLRGGGARKGASFANAQLSSIEPVTLRNDFLLQGAELAVFGKFNCDAVGFAIFDSDGDGLDLSAGNVANFAGSAALYGAGNTDSGVQCKSGGQLIYDSTLPNIFGAQDLTIGGVNHVWNDVTVAGGSIFDTTHACGVINLV